MNKWIVPSSARGEVALLAILLFFLFFVLSRIIRIVPRQIPESPSFFNEPISATLVIISWVLGTGAFVVGFFASSVEKRRQFPYLLRSFLGYSSVFSVSGRFWIPIKTNQHSNFAFLSQLASIQKLDYVETMPIFENRAQPLLSRRGFIKRQVRFTLISMGLILGFMIVGMVGYVSLAHLNFVDSFLNAAMIMGGMGPVAVLTDTPAKIFAGIYALLCGIILLVAVGVILAPGLHRIMHVLHLETKQ